jgi:hypothetical protein
MFDVPLDNDVIPVNQLLMDQTARWWMSCIDSILVVALWVQSISEAISVWVHFLGQFDQHRTIHPIFSPTMTPKFSVNLFKPYGSNEYWLSQWIVVVGPNQGFDSVQCVVISSITVVKMMPIAIWEETNEWLTLVLNYSFPLSAIILQWR